MLKVIIEMDICWIKTAYVDEKELQTTNMFLQINFLFLGIKVLFLNCLRDWDVFFFNLKSFKVQKKLKISNFKILLAHWIWVQLPFMFLLHLLKFAAFMHTRTPDIAGFLWRLRSLESSCPEPLGQHELLAVTYHGVCAFNL